MMKRIFARDCKVKEIDNSTACAFEDGNHLQGGIKATISFGLYYKTNELLQVETFGFDRMGSQADNEKYDAEMLRECSKKGYEVVGGKSRLLNAFIKKYQPHNIISYCSLEEGFDGHSYVACGFKLVRRQTGSYHYQLNGKKYTRNAFQKNSNLEALGKKCPLHKVCDSCNVEYDATKTEKEIAAQLGAIRIEEKGNLVFELCLKPFEGRIYLTKNNVNGKVYIGQHNTLSDDGYVGSGSLLRRAIDKYGAENFTTTTLEILKDYRYKCDFERAMDEAEKYWIERYNSTDKNIGYNILSGGQSNSYSIFRNKKSAEARKGKKGKPLSEAAKAKISKASKLWWQDEEHKKHFVKAIAGQHRTEETKRKMSEAQKGKHCSEETKQKLSVINTGKHPSVETRRKMSEAQKGEKNYFYGKCHSEESRAKISASTKIALSKPEAIEKMRKFYTFNGVKYIGRDAACKGIGISTSELKRRVKKGLIKVEKNK